MRSEAGSTARCSEKCRVVRDRVEILFLGDVPEDAFHALFTEFTCETAGALPGHWVGGDRYPGTVKASSVCPVLDPNFVYLDEVKGGSGNKREPS